MAASRPKPRHPKSPAHPWERNGHLLIKKTTRKPEGLDAYRNFVLFRDLGADRSYAAVRKRVGTKSEPGRIIERWGSPQNYAWQERVKAWEDHLVSERDAATEAAARAEAEQWAQRGSTYRENVYNLLERFRAKIEVMLGASLFETRIVKGADGAETHLHPTDKWTIGQAAHLARAMVDLANAAGLSKTNLAVTVSGKIDFSALSEEQLMRIANGEPLEQVMRK